MFLFSVSHGARASEIANLRIDDINFKAGQVHIQRLKGSLDSVQMMLKVKGNSLFDEAAAFKAWLAIRKTDADNFVFNTDQSTRISRIRIYQIFKKIAQSVGLPVNLQHPHTLKHVTAMMMLQSGSNAFMIRQQLGHKAFESTLSYVRPSDSEASAEAIKAFNKIF
jgi:integrase